MSRNKVTSSFDQIGTKFAVHIVGIPKTADDDRFSRRVRHGVGHTRDQIRLIVGIGHGHLARRLACTVPVCVIRIGRRLSALGHRHQPVKPVIFICSAALLHIADGQRISAFSPLPNAVNISITLYSFFSGNS